MTFSPKQQARLQFLARLIRKEIRHLQSTDRRLFPVSFTREMTERLAADELLAERVEAFVSRFGRLQDTVGGKLLPSYLDAVGEAIGTVVDNLNRAEKLGLINSADEWMALRGLRNQMIHVYIEDLDVLTDALNKGHSHVFTLTDAAAKIVADLAARGWVTENQ